MPGDLTGLLGCLALPVGRLDAIQALLGVGIESTRALLRIPDDPMERRLHGRPMTPALWGAVADRLAERVGSGALPPGVKLGCLAAHAQPQVQAQPPALRVVGGVDVEPIEDSNPARRLAAKLRRQNAACT